MEREEVSKVRQVLIIIHGIIGESTEGTAFNN